MFDVGETSYADGAFLGGGQDGQEEGGQDADDGNDHEEFNQRETPGAGGAGRLGIEGRVEDRVSKFMAYVS